MLWKQGWRQKWLENRTTLSTCVTVPRKYPKYPKPVVSSLTEASTGHGPTKCRRSIACRSTMLPCPGKTGSRAQNVFQSQIRLITGISSPFHNALPFVKLFAMRGVPVLVSPILAT